MKQFSDPETGHRRSDAVYMGTADVCERRHKPVSAAVDPRPFAFAFENGERLSGHTFDVPATPAICVTRSAEMRSPDSRERTCAERE